LKIIILRFTSAIIAIIVGLVIVKLSLAAAPIIRDNIVSCLPEELSEMFDKEQSTLCSNIESNKDTLVTGVLAGGGLALMGIVSVLVSTFHLLRGKTKDPRKFSPSKL
jgi:hypothetical protein